MKRIHPISKLAAEELLAPHYRSLDRSIRYGWATWVALPDELRRPIENNKIARANWVNAQMVAAARLEFAGVEGVWRGYRNQQFTVDIEDLVVVRFKLLDDHFGTSSIRTMQQLRWDGQLALSGSPAHATRLTAGYQLNRDETDIECVAITCCNDGHLDWVIVLPDFGFGLGGATATLLPDSDPGDGPRIGPKIVEKEQDEDVG